MSRAPLDPELVDAALERVGEGVILINAQGEVLTLNRAARALFATLGVHGPDGLREHHQVLEADGRTVRPSTKSPLRRAIGGESVDDELVLYGPGAEDGLWLSVTARPVLNPAGEIVGAIETIRDVSGQRRRARALAQSEARYRDLTELVAEFSYEMRLDQGRLRPVWVTDRFPKLTGWRAEELDQEGGLRRLMHPVDHEVVKAHLRTILAGDTHEAELRLVTRDGETRWVRAVGRPLRDEDGGPILGVLGAARDVTHHKLSDRLTGLPNHRALRDRLQVALRQLDRWPETQLTLMHVELDRFMTINQSLGYAAGDTVLRESACRLVGLLPSSETVAHLRSDEFGIVHLGLKRPSEALKLAEEIIERLGEPLLIDGETLTPSVSVGVTFARSSTDRPAELFREAQTAARRARELGGRRGEVYDPELQRVATTRLRREAKLREAIREGRIDAVMQPILRLSDEKIIGFEALARLAEPDGGLVPPDTFVPIAEELGLISTISERVLRRALIAVQRWRALPGHGHLTVSVNISAQEVNSQDVLPRVLRALTEAEAPGEALRLELTETALVQSPDAPAMLRRLRERGVRICLDDFGTGHSSLSTLAHLPIDQLKLDRAFLARLGLDPAADRFLEAVFAFADALGLETIAEGVEHERQRITLRRLGCRYAQGFLLGRPMSVEAAEGLLGG
ncbi:EAL domain-containing protein [Myxococcota bacterium]|nr:EAL domain-containing protein [Myxococcota bacterium]